MSPTEKVLHHFVILLTDIVKTRKNHTTVTDLNHINFVNLFFNNRLLKFVNFFQI